MRLLRALHRYLGLALALPMLVQGVTGCILAATPLWEAGRPLLEGLPALTAGVPQPASAVLAAVARPALVPVRYAPGGPGAAAQVDLAASGQRGASLQILVDPVSLAVVGQRPASAAYRWVRSLHESVLLPPMPGRAIVGWEGVGLLVLGLTGLVLWWPPALQPGRWRRAVTVRGTARGARLQRELHGAAGFWLSGMLVVISLSGATLGFPQTVRGVLGLPAGQRPVPADGTLGIDAVLRRAAAAVPGAALLEARLPNGPGRAVMVRMAPPGGATAMVLIDPAGNRVLSLQDPASQPIAAQALNGLRALHYGEAFGWPWRLLVVAAGALLPLLAVTGAALWLLKRRNRHRLRVQRRAALQAAAE